MPIATLTDLSIAFGTDQILDHIELTIESGERIALTGRNGAGKGMMINSSRAILYASTDDNWREAAAQAALETRNAINAVP